MAEIKLGGTELVAVIDEEDVELVSKHRWYAVTFTKSNTVYAQTNITDSNGKRAVLLMHVLIMGARGIDHKDGIGLNNQRSNLRHATQSQNIANAAIHSDNTSGYKGVSFRKDKNKWQARITVKYKAIFLGFFVDKDDAAHAYDKAARELFGEFARLNFPVQKLT